MCGKHTEKPNGQPEGAFPGIGKIFVKCAGKCAMWAPACLAGARTRCHRLKTFMAFFDPWPLSLAEGSAGRIYYTQQMCSHHSIAAWNDDRAFQYSAQLSYIFEPILFRAACALRIFHRPRVCDKSNRGDLQIKMSTTIDAWAKGMSWLGVVCYIGLQTVVRICGKCYALF